MTELAEAVRVRQGAAPDTPPEVLRRLALDQSVKVRATLAMNPATPAQVDATLARDGDERVRLLLAKKLSALAPTLSGPAQTRLRDQTFGLLTALVADAAVRVRAAIAEELKSLPDAPRDVIMRLARDEAVMVCEPVILFSPQLTEEDLVALVASAPSPATVTSVAHRAGIGASVSDAIARTANEEAIRALLSNQSAHIREATLDALVAQAEAHENWHEPLVRRPSLSARAQRTLAEIVASHLLDELARRTDLDPGVAASLRHGIAQRLVPAPIEGVDDMASGTALAEARHLVAEGRLTEDILLDAGRRGQTRRAAAMLAVKASVPLAVVEQAGALRSAKGLISLSWAAGFSMRSATMLQTLLARLAPDAVVGPAADGGFPLSEGEMSWQVEVLGGDGRA